MKGKREKRRRRHPAMHFPRNPQKAGRRQRRDQQDDQLHRRLQPDQLAERDDQQIDAEVADRRPVIVVIALEPGRMLRGRARPGSGPYGRADRRAAAPAGKATAARSRKRRAPGHHADSHQGAASLGNRPAGAASTPIVTCPQCRTAARPSGIGPIVHAGTVRMTGNSHFIHADRDARCRSRFAPVQLPASFEGLLDRQSQGGGTR